MQDSSELTYIDQIDEKIDLAYSLVKKLDCDYPNVEGSTKTKKNILKEIKFLEKVSETIYIAKSRTHRQFHLISAETTSN